MKVLTVLYMLVAQDMDRAVAFYRDTFGFGVKMQSPDWSELTYGDAVVAFHGGGKGEFNRTGFGLDVDDIHEATKRAEQNGARVLSAPQDKPEEGIWLAELADPENNYFMLSQSR